MSPELIGAAWAVAVIVVGALIVYLSGHLARVWKSPKRIDRLEGNQVHMMDALDIIFDISSLNIRVLQGHKVNGELAEAEKRMATSREQYRKYLNSQSVSRPEKK